MVEKDISHPLQNVAERSISLPQGVQPATYAFLLKAIEFKAYQNLDVRHRNLIGVYFGTETTLQQLIPQAQVTTRSRVQQLIVSGLERLWTNLPAEVQAQSIKEEIIQLKRGFSLESRAKMSDAHKGRVVSDESRAKMSKALKGRTHTPETRAKISKAHQKRRQKPVDFNS